MHAHGRNLGSGPTFPGGPDDPLEIDRSTQNSSTNLTLQVDRYDEFAKPDHMDRASISGTHRDGSEKLEVDGSQPWQEGP